MDFKGSLFTISKQCSQCSLGRGNLRRCSHSPWTSLSPNKNNSRFIGLLIPGSKQKHAEIGFFWRPHASGQNKLTYSTTIIWSVTPKKTNMTWWKIHHLKMHFLSKMVIFQCHLSFQGVTRLSIIILSSCCHLSSLVGGVSGCPFILPRCSGLHPNNAKNKDIQTFHKFKILVYLDILPKKILIILVVDKSSFLSWSRITMEKPMCCLWMIYIPHGLWHRLSINNQFWR